MGERNGILANEKHQKAFNNVKATAVTDITLACPDFTKPVEIYTDASTALGSVITQKYKTNSILQRKLTGAQKWYSVTKVELLAIVETLKEFKGMLWGQKLKVYAEAI